MLEDKTIIQHFISQTELRLNTSTPDCHNKNKKIFVFEIDKQSNGENVFPPQNRKIANSLFLHDLFTINNTDKTRQNFEKLFHKYESSVSEATLLLLTKIENNDNDISEELFKILSLKILNSFRNPFSIKKTLNTIGMLADHYPTSDDLKKEYLLIRDGIKPHLARILPILEITEDEYFRWLRCLFMLLAVDIQKNVNMLDDMLINLLKDKESQTGMALFRYTHNHGIAVSDRGILSISNEPEKFGFDININERMFLRFFNVSLSSLLPSGISEQFIDAYKSKDKIVQLVIYDDDLEHLKNYNQCAVLQSAKEVYCSKSTIYGVNIINKTNQEN